VLRVLRDLLRHNLEFLAGAMLVGLVALMACLAFVSPYDPDAIYLLPPDLPPSMEHWLGTTSRGQDVFWQITFALQNTLMFGIVVAAVSRVIALTVGMLSGYLGGWVDWVLMSLNDTLMALPSFPILILFYFVMKDDVSWLMLAFVAALLGWSYDARLIRSVAIGLRSREFTRHGVFAGMSTATILAEEHLPYVLPVVFYTTMNNLIWAIGLEVTLSVLGFTDINRPSVGGMIFWANQHSAMVSGIWWWVLAPVAVVIVLFLGLFLLAMSLNEYVDPRSRLVRAGA
jgi:peptide/nickel transport system permease protein